MLYPTSRTILRGDVEALPHGRGQTVRRMDCSKPGNSPTCASAASPVTRRAVEARCSYSGDGMGVPSTARGMTTCAPQPPAN